MTRKRTEPKPRVSLVMEPIAIDLDTAAALVSMSRSVLEHEIRAGHLVARKAGRRTLVSRHALVEWFDSRPDWREATLAGAVIDMPVPTDIGRQRGAQYVP